MSEPSIKELCTLVGNNAARITRLWKNEDLSSAYAAQKVELDLSEYDAVIVTAVTATTSHNVLSTLLIEIGDGAMLIGFAAAKIAYRTFTVTATGVTFNGGYMYNTYGNTTETANNSYIIPQRIYGVKNIG